MIMERMTAEELAGLKAAAMSATPGPWELHIDGTCSGASPRIVTAAVDEDGEHFDIADLSTSHVETEAARNSSEFPGTYSEKPHRFELTFDGKQILADAAYLVSVDPSTILRLVEQAGRVDSFEREVKELHRELAAEALRADLGWERYEAANRDRNSLRAAMCQATQLDAPAPPEVAVEQKPVARLQSYESDRPYSKGQQFFEVIVLDRARCTDGMELFATSPAAPVAGAPVIPEGEK